jgi:predicted ATPase
LTDEYGLEVWACFGNIDLAWSNAELGDAERGIAQMKRSLEAYEATGAKLRCPYFLGLLADQLGKAGRVIEGLEAIAKAVTLAERNGERYWIAELHRINGELIIKRCDLAQQEDVEDGSTLSVNNEISATLLQAEACFAEALAIAKQQGTKSWELRIALSMNRLQVRRGKPTNTHLAELFSSFTEGHETADLRQAKAWLNAMVLA